MSTILMLHGVGSSADAWVKLAPAFRDRGWKVVTPTLRDELRPTANPPAELNKISLADYVADVSALAREIAAADGRAPVVFGHSMGGMLAQKLAEAGLVRGAVLITPASPPDARAGRSLAQAVTFANILFSGRPENRPHRIWKFGFTTGVLNCVPKARHEALFAESRYDSGRVYADLAYPEDDPNRTIFVDESRITVPMLVIGGARDRTTPIADVRLVAQKYKKVGADYREYADNGHWIVDEPGTDKVIVDIAAFLEAKGLTPSATKPRTVPAAKPKTAAKPAKAKAKPAAKAAAKPAAKKTAAKAQPALKPAAKKAAPKKAAAPAKAAAPKPAAKKPAKKPAAAAKPKAVAKKPAPKKR
jgi:pimeloyl-ACP methyl ester carboxylesterase